MQRRLFETLGDWAVAADAALHDKLAALGETPGDLSRARVLFAKALETPGGLKIQTLHAFCEALLRRFPLEAGVAPGFTVLDDAGAAEVSSRARDRLAERVLADPEHAVARAYAHFAVELDLDSFEGLLRVFESERRTIEAYFADCGGFEGAIADVWAHCGFQSLTSVAALGAEAMAATDWTAWRRAAEALNRGGPQDQSVAQALAAAIEWSGPEDDRFDRAWRAFSTDKGE